MPFPINESLLQFIWQHQLFNKQALQTATGEPLEIIRRGMLNTNQGPDFSAARIRIGATEWVGSIELHRHTSDWFRHRHQSDVNYHKVILHVVWQNDQPPHQLSIPVFELLTRVPGTLLQRYGQWMAAEKQIPCGSLLAGVEPLLVMNWLERLAAERLTERAQVLLKQRYQPDKQWKEIFWQVIARYFGGIVNGDAFEQIAHQLPVRMLERHTGQLHQLEALLMGQAGLLEASFTDSYPIMLQKEYRFLKRKYRLPEPRFPVHFLRMRPGSFPTIRLAQLSVLLNTPTDLFEQLQHCPEVYDMEKRLDLTANDYWHYHYRFDELSVFYPKQTGKAFRHSIILNACCPVLFAMGIENNNQALINKALAWMGKMPAEKNSIVTQFMDRGVKVANSLESQALLHLKSAYCDCYRCLSCAIGTSLLKRIPEESVTAEQAMNR